MQEDGYVPETDLLRRKNNPGVRDRLVIDVDAAPEILDDPFVEVEREHGVTRRDTLRRNGDMRSDIVADDVFTRRQVLLQEQPLALVDRNLSHERRHPPRYKVFVTGRQLPR